MSDLMGDVELRGRREAALLSLIEAENRADIEAVCAVFPEPRYELIGTHKVHTGRRGVEQHLRDRIAIFPDYRTELIAHHHADDGIIAEVWAMGTHRGAIENIAPTGKGFRCRMAAFYLFDGPRLRCVRLYFDSATIARQLA
jgi:predicted ester cyclase